MKIIVLGLFCLIAFVSHNSAESCSESTSCDDNGCKTVRNCDYSKGNSASSSSSSSGKYSRTRTTKCVNGNCTICENGKCRTEIQKGGSKQGSSSSSSSRSGSGRSWSSSKAGDDDSDEDVFYRKKRSAWDDMFSGIRKFN